MTPSSRGLLLQFYVIILILQRVCGFFGLTSQEPILILTPEFEERMRGLELSKKATSVDLCNLLVLQRKQKRQCRRGSGIAETLVRATHLSAFECQQQFLHERWNCSLLEYRKHVLKRGFKETAFLFAISSAGLVHQVARACAQGLIDRCTCDESKHFKNTETWRWGGCGDNIRFGVQFALPFLRASRRSEKDVRAQVNEHNSNVGINVVRDLVTEKCKCHGVSGTCTVKTCWMQLSPFKTVGDIIKSKYDTAVKVLSLPNHTAGKSYLMKRPNIYAGTSSSLHEKNLVPLGKDELTYIEDSPNFCLSSNYSPGTSGRKCIKGENCDSICCGNGYNIQKQTLTKNCKCEVIWCCKYKCKLCLIEKDVYLCK